jgi:glycosyltransferase involved in cell wall biosynthesis
VYVTERRFLDECAKRAGVTVNTFTFGSRRADESLFVRVVRTFGDVATFVRLVRRDPPDLVQINSAFDRRGIVRDIWYAFASRMTRTRLFIKYHGSDAAMTRGQSPLIRWIIRYTWESVAGLGVLSNEERRNFVNAGCNPETCVVVKNVVDWERFAAAATGPSGTGGLLFIARFIPSKGLLDVIQAVRLLADAGSDVHLDCVGDGELRPEAERLVASLGLEGRVHFHGYVSEAETTPYYLKSSMLLFPTHREGFSMTIFQALAAGLPIITTRIRAAADYLREPDNCLWVDPGNPRMLAEKARCLLDDKGQRAQMSRNNRELARKFSASAVTDEYLALYRGIVHAGRVRVEATPDGR